MALSESASPSSRRDGTEHGYVRAPRGHAGFTSQELNGVSKCQVGVESSEGSVTHRTDTEMESDDSEDSTRAIGKQGRPSHV